MQSSKYLQLISALLAAFLSYRLWRVVYNIYFHPLARIPGPRTWSTTRFPYLRSFFRGTIVQEFQQLHKRYEPILRVAPDEVTFANPRAWRDILAGRADHKPFLKDPVWWKAMPGMAVSISSVIDTKPHSRLRKLLSPGFTTRALAEQEPTLHQYTDLLVDRLRLQLDPNGNMWTEIDIGPWCNFTTFDIFGNLGYGESFGCLRDSRYHPWIALLFGSVKTAAYAAASRFYPAIEWLLFKCIPPSMKRKRQSHYLIIVDKVNRRLNLEVKRSDIMEHVIKGLGKEGRGGDDEEGTDAVDKGQLYTTFMALTTAGSETTATALTGRLNYLVSCPDKLEAVVREVRTRCRPDEEGGQHKASLDNLQGLPYLNAVIHEGLRLCPPVPWVLPRRVPESGDTVCGKWLPAGTAVSIQQYTMNRDEANFHRPAEFIPERWIDVTAPSPFANDQRSVVQTFSVGPRSCLGQHLAWAELRLVLAKLLYNFDFNCSLPSTGQRLRWEELRTFLLVEKKPVLIGMKPRSKYDMKKLNEA